MDDVTFREFAALIKQNRWMLDFLVERCRSVEDPTRFFREVLSGNYPEKVIPYQSVLQLYFAATIPPLEAVPYAALGIPYRVVSDPLGLMKPETVQLRSRLRPCPCGCGQTLAPRKHYATPACGRRLRKPPLRQSVTKKAA